MTEHRNNIGFIRLVLATMVVIGHAPEMTDGNRLREPLTVLFHTLSLGVAAVQGFFLISGYLITQSYYSSHSTVDYLRRRVFRIYPAFIVAYLASVIILAPLVGGRTDLSLHALYRMFFLQSPPSTPGLLKGLHYPALNGSMWTIAYEFRCYLLVLLLGVTGVLSNRKAVLALAILTAIGAVAETFDPVRRWSDAFDGRWHVESLIGSLSWTIQLTTTFLIGVCVYLFRADILRRLDWRLALGCCVVMIPLLCFPHSANTATITLGACCLFWLAFKANIGPLQQINDQWDISYGVYLYGWPVAATLLWFNRSISPWTLATLAIPITLIFGAISWWGVERWTKGLGRAQTMRRHEVQHPVT